MQKFSKISAYAILSIHLAFTLFILLAPFAILVGKWQHWSWSQNPTFRDAHLFFVMFIIVEVIFSIPCFLTEMENCCRKKANMPLYTSGFFDYWGAVILASRYQNWMFITLFTIVSVASFMVYVAIPPRPFHHVDSVVKPLRLLLQARF